MKRPGDLVTPTLVWWGKNSTNDLPRSALVIAVDGFGMLMLLYSTGFIEECADFEELVVVSTK